MAIDCLVCDKPHLSLVGRELPGIDKGSNRVHSTRTQVYRIDLYTLLVHNTGFGEILHSDASEIYFKG